MPNIEIIRFNHFTARKSERYTATHNGLYVVEEGSLAAAAKKLNVPMSTMSRRLTALEKRLSTNLVQKQGRELVATEDGQRIFDLLRCGLEDLESNFSKVRADNQDVAGNIKLVIPHKLYRSRVSRIVEQFLIDYPKVPIELVLSQEQSFPLTQRDLLISFDLTGAEDMVARPLFRAHHAFFASPEYIKKVGKVKTIDRLAELDWLSVDHVRDISICEGNALVGRIEIKPKLVINDVMAVFDAAERGLGVASLPLMHMDENMNLVRVLPQYQRKPRQAYLIYQKRRYQPQALSILVDRLIHDAEAMK